MADHREEPGSGKRQDGSGPGRAARLSTASGQHDPSGCKCLRRPSVRRRRATDEVARGIAGEVGPWVEGEDPRTAVRVRVGKR